MDKIVLRGWKSICNALDYSPDSYKIVRRMLKSVDILKYERGKPVVKVSDLEEYYFSIKKESQA